MRNDLFPVILICGIILIGLKVYIVIRCLICPKIDSNNIEEEVENHGFEEIEIAEQEIETETEIVFQIEMDPNAPPPDYNEIEYNSTSIPKRSYVTSSSSLPAYEQI